MLLYWRVWQNGKPTSGFAWGNGRLTIICVHCCRCCFQIFAENKLRMSLLWQWDQWGSVMLRWFDFYTKTVVSVTCRFLSCIIAWQRGTGWCHGAVSRASYLRSRGRGFESRLGTRLKNSGQVSHTCVPLSPNSITWYWPNSGVAQWLRR